MNDCRGNKKRILQPGQGKAGRTCLSFGTFRLVMVSLTNDDAVIINYGGLGERIQIFTKIPCFFDFSKW